MTNKKRLILFDLDGTLIDSHEAIYFSAISVMSDYTSKLPDRETVYKSVGLPIKKLFSDYLDVSELDEAVIEFRSHLALNGEQRTKLKPSALDLLEKLKANDFNIVLITNKQSNLAKIVLSQQGLLGFFDLVVGSDMGQPKPSPEMINYALKNFPEHEFCVMVGDRVEDIIASRDAGVSSIFLQNSITPDFLVDNLEPYHPAKVSNLKDVYGSYIKLMEAVNV